MPREPEPYALSDLTIQSLNSSALKRLRQTKRQLLADPLGFDEVNIFKYLTALYDALDEDNRESFFLLYCRRYLGVLCWLRDREDSVENLLEMYLAGLMPEWDRLDNDELIAAIYETDFPHDGKIGEKADEYLEQLLSTPNPVTQVAYDTEVYRKRDRAIEAVTATIGVRNKQIEMDRQIQYWSRSTGWYSDIIDEGANEDAIRDAGIKKVRWVTQHDGRVCGECESLDGNIYPVGDVPEHPHRNCRCYVVPV